MVCEIYGLPLWSGDILTADRSKRTSGALRPQLHTRFFRTGQKGIGRGKGETDALLSYVDSGDRAKRRSPVRISGSSMTRSARRWIRTELWLRWRRTFTEHRTMWMVRLHGQPTRGTVFFSLRDFTDGYIDQKIRFLAETMRS